LSQNEDAAKLKTLADNGVKITEPTPELRAQLLATAQPMWQQFIDEVGPQAEEVVGAYRAQTGK
jgi:TRAP-type C4-dicarboxylate transport system substrate-binding protein